jgi:cephalosporin hydroxylase
MLGQIIRDIISVSRKKRDKVESQAEQTGKDNPLAEYFYNNPAQGACKWHHYFEIYHRHFARFRGHAPVVVEIGVAFGGSLQMWHHYFGPATRVVGIDVDPACRQFEDSSTTIMIGDQGNRDFLGTVRERVPHIDILIDDGGHTMAQQIATFEELYPHIQPNGVYLCEDVHTSLLPNFGGGYLRKGTFLEYSKALVDRLFSWHSPDPAALMVDEFTLTTHGMYFYGGVVVMEKRRMEPPRQFMTYGANPPGTDPGSPQFRL